MQGARQAGSIWEDYAFGLWSAKQIRTKAAFRLWYVKHVLRGEPELTTQLIRSRTQVDEAPPPPGRGEPRQATAPPPAGTGR